MKTKSARAVRLCLICLLAGAQYSLPAAAAPAKVSLTNYQSLRTESRGVVFTTDTGQRLRLTPYGNYIVRVQAVRRGEDFFPDDRYEMVESHDWPGGFRLLEQESFVRLETPAPDGLVIEVSKTPLRVSFYLKGTTRPLLREDVGVSWDGSRIREQFVYDEQEHFTGLGHGYFGRADGLDLKGRLIERNYGTEHGQQAPLIVPFYLSSKGYGLFLNSTFTNAFDFGRDGAYEFTLDDRGFGGRMDYFVIAGPRFAEILDRYTRLTGRPRLPPLSIFGLALSDKSNDETSPDPSDENWWKRKVAEHRRAGFPLDHLINDNRWRAGGGKRCESYFDWDRTRFPDPAEYERWLKANGLVTTIDFNRCIAQRSEGWSPSYNVPVTAGIDFGQSAPDFTRPEVRSWFWRLFWRKSLNPRLGYPGDALWIDEFDELGPAPLSMRLGDGRSWAEMRNYWFFLIAKALVQEGWDKEIGPSKRPFVWVRGMTAGAQRYATLWSGDIKPSYDDMRSQIRGLQLAGLSGFPYWGHDAGGFYDYDRRSGPDDNMYRQWSMAFGSFTPFWKPHGFGQSRWPLDRSPEAQADATTYCELRYRLMPYIYTYAYQAHTTGVPIARAMVIEHQDEPLAWQHDLQYMWGREMLVAPNTSDGGDVSVWLPRGDWYDFWSDTKYSGDQTISYAAPTGRLPLFVKAGAIIPTALPAVSTSALPKDKLVVEVYTGRDGGFSLYEDDGGSEAYRTKGEYRLTEMRFTQREMRLVISAARGTYKGATDSRSYRLNFHGLSRPFGLEVNGARLPSFASEQEAFWAGAGVVWDARRKVLSAFVRRSPVRQSISVKASDAAGT